MAIRLAADLASKKAMEDMKGGTSTLPSSTSSSRARIREILAKQRQEQETKQSDKEEAERKASAAFDPSNRKLLWVFR